MKEETEISLSSYELVERIHYLQVVMLHNPEIKADVKDYLWEEILSAKFSLRDRERGGLSLAVLKTLLCPISYFDELVAQINAIRSLIKDLNTKTYEGNFTPTDEYKGETLNDWHMWLRYQLETLIHNLAKHLDDSSVRWE